MPIAGRIAVCIVLCGAVMAAGCGTRVLKPEYEYEEELYLDLDGSATLNMNASVPALVALHGVDLPVDPAARLDRQKVRALFARAGSAVTISLSRRDGRRFVHVSVDVDDVRALSAFPILAWSKYEFAANEDRVTYHQVVGPPAGRPVGDVGWDGTELVGFRVHLPSEILFQNSGSDTQRGNILEWEQRLADRLEGQPLDLQVQLAPQSILYTTLLLFGSTIVAAALAFALVVWWVMRRGRHTDVAESHS
jgi:hypothetical protein